MKLIECSNGGYQTTSVSSFGELEAGSFCGKLKDRNYFSGQNQSKLTDLFQKMGVKGNREGSWITASGPSGTVSCTQGSKTGVIAGEPDGIRLGYCDGSQDSKGTSFLNINKTGESKVNGMKYCEKDCGAEETESQSVQRLTNKKESNGIDLEFYKLS